MFARTCSESAFVDPGMHVLALIFKLANLILRIFELILEILELILEGSDSVVEGLGQGIRRGLHAGSDGSVRHVPRSHGRTSRGGIVALIASCGRSI